MLFNTFVAILATAAATVSATGEMRMREAASQCGNGQSLSCCRSGDDGDKGLLSGVAKNIASGNCDQVPINIIGANGILQQACGSNQAACCGSQDGLAGVDCNPIEV